MFSIINKPYWQKGGFVKHTQKIVVVMLCLLLCSAAVAMPGSRVENDHSRPTKKIVTRHEVPYYPSGRQGGVLFVEDRSSDWGGPATYPDPVWEAMLDYLYGSGNYGWYGATMTPGENGPDLATMQGYDLVIWCTYDYWWTDTAALTPTDQTNLGQYMEGGGYVWLISQDGLYTGVPYSWMNTYFGLQTANEDYLFPADSMQMHGLAEIDSITLWSIPDYQSNAFFPDELIPESYAHAVVEDIDLSYDIGIYYDATVWRSSFWSCDGRVQPGSGFWDNWVSMVEGMLGPDLFDVLGVAETPSQEPLRQLQLTITPDPLVRTATINYTLPIADHTQLQVYNKLGQHVTTLVDAYTPAGSYKVTWNGTDARGSDVPNGVYFVRLTCGDFSTAANMVVVK